MAIGELIEQIAAGWPAYHEKVRVDKSDPVYELVTNQFPRELQLYATAYDTLTVQGSTGAGNITAAPWIALFDRRLTKSATTGYYIVYLFSTDMSTVTLCLAFGTTQFEEQFGGPSAAFPRMRFAAARLQEMFNHLIPAKMSRGPIELRAEPRQRLHYAYQQSAILSYPPYRIGALPEEPQLIADLQEIVQLYIAIVSDPLEVTIERLVEAVVEPAARVETIEVHDFEPRSPRKSREPNGQGNQGGQRRRYSPESRKVGDAGERVVIRHEKESLIKLGRQDLADRVRYHAQELEFVGWDITSFDEKGNEIFIEVKSSVGKTVSSVNLTVNEWEAACSLARRDRYYIYIVTNALSAKPNIERLLNPASHVDAKQLSCEAVVYRIATEPALKIFSIYSELGRRSHASQPIANSSLARLGRWSLFRVPIRLPQQALTLEAGRAYTGTNGFAVTISGVVWSAHQMG